MSEKQKRLEEIKPRIDAIERVTWIHVTNLRETELDAALRYRNALARGSLQHKQNLLLDLRMLENHEVQKLVQYVREGMSKEDEHG